MKWKKIEAALSILSVMGVGVGATLAFNSDNIDRRVTVAIGLGIVLPIMALLINLIVRLNDLERVSSELGGRIAGLPQSVSTIASNMGFSAVTSLLSRPSAMELAREQYQDLLSLVAQKSSDIERGHFWETDPSNVHRFVRKLFSTATKEIESTSIVDIESFWGATEADQYLNSQKALMQNDVLIKRTFIFASTEEAQSAKAQEEMRKQKYDYGFDIFYLINDYKSKDAERIRRDFGLIDGEDDDSAMAIFCAVDSYSQRIHRVDAFVRDTDKLDEAKTLLAAVKARRIRFAGESRQVTSDHEES